MRKLDVAALLFFSQLRSHQNPTHATQHFPPNHLPHTRAPRTVQFDMPVMADVTNTHGTHQSTVVKPAHNWEHLYMRKNGSAKQFLAFALKFGCISDRPGYTAGHNGYGIFYQLPIDMLELIITMALKDQITAEPKNNKDSAALLSTGALKYYGINKYTAHMVCQDGSPAIDKVSRGARTRPPIHPLAEPRSRRSSASSAASATRTCTSRTSCAPSSSRARRAGRGSRRATSCSTSRTRTCATTRGPCPSTSMPSRCARRVRTPRPRRA